MQELKEDIDDDVASVMATGSVATARMSNVTTRKLKESDQKPANEAFYTELESLVERLLEPVIGSGNEQLRLAVVYFLISGPGMVSMQGIHVSNFRTGLGNYYVQNDLQQPDARIIDRLVQLFQIHGPVEAYNYVLLVAKELQQLEAPTVAAPPSSTGVQELFFHNLNLQGNGGSASLNASESTAFVSATTDELRLEEDQQGAPTPQQIEFKKGSTVSPARSSGGSSLSSKNSAAGSLTSEDRVNLPMDTTEPLASIEESKASDQSPKSEEP